MEIKKILTLGSSRVGDSGVNIINDSIFIIKTKLIDNKYAKLIFHSRILLAFNLTPESKIRYGLDIHIIPEFLPILGYSQYTTSRFSI